MTFSTLRFGVAIWALGMTALFSVAVAEDWQALGEDDQAKYFYVLRNPDLSDSIISLNMRAVAKNPVSVALYSSYRQLCTTVLGGCTVKQENILRGPADPLAAVQEMEMALYYNCETHKYQKQQVLFFEKHGTLISKHTPNKTKPKWRHFMPQNAHLEKYGNTICALANKN